MPFELKPNMRLAPAQRHQLTDEGKNALDEAILTQVSLQIEYSFKS